MRYNPQMELEELAKLKPKIRKAKAVQDKKEKNGYWIKVSELGNLIKFVKDE